MNNIIKIPKRFFEDHRDCCDEEATPKIIKETKKHYFISRDDDQFWNLKSNCEYMIEAHSLGQEWYCSPQNFGLVMSARATLKAIKEE